MTTLTVSHFGDMLTEFQKQNPGVRLEVILMDRSVNPMEEGFDVAIGALPATYANVVDIPLWPPPLHDGRVPRISGEGRNADPSA